MPKDDFTENSDHNVILKLGDGGNEKVSFESRRDVLSPANRRTHSAHQLELDQFDSRRVFSVVPVHENLSV